jgi:hypothetical protein
VKRFRILIYAVVGIVLLSRLAVAGETYGLFAKERASIAAGAQYETISGRSEWTAGTFAAYNLLQSSPAAPKLPRLSLVGSVVYGVTSERVRYAAGLRWRIWSGKAGDAK